MASPNTAKKIERNSEQDRYYAELNRKERLNQLKEARTQSLERIKNVGSGVGSVAKLGWGALNKPASVARGKGGVLGYVGAFLRWLKDTISGSLQIIVIGTLIVIALLAGYFWISSGQAGTSVTAIAQTIDDKIVTPVFGQGSIGDIWLKITGRRSMVQYGFEGDVEQSYTEERGVKITEMWSDSSDNRFAEGNPVSIYASVEAHAYKPMSIEFNCRYANGLGKGKDIVVPAIVSHYSAQGTNRIQLAEKEENLFPVKCAFPAGVFKLTQREGLSEILWKEREIEAKKVNLEVIYNYPSLAYAKYYTINPVELEKARILKKDPLADSGINDPHINSQGIARSIADESPMLLSIMTHSKQPLTTETPYTFTISLENNLFKWNGEMVALSGIDVAVSPAISVGGMQSDIIQASSESACDFEDSGTFNEDGFRVYRLKNSILSSINKQCSNTNFKSENYAGWQKTCNSLRFNCDFIIPEVSGDGINTDFMRVDAGYYYMTKQNMQINIIGKLKQELVG